MNELNTEPIELYANRVAAGAMRKFAENLVRRAANAPNALTAGGLLDAARLAEEVAKNLESIT